MAESQLCRCFWAGPPDLLSRVPKPGSCPHPCLGRSSPGGHVPHVSQAAWAGPAHPGHPPHFPLPGRPHGLGFWGRGQSPRALPCPPLWASAGVHSRAGVLEWLPLGRRAGSKRSDTTLPGSASCYDWAPHSHLFQWALAGAVISADWPWCHLFTLSLPGSSCSLLRPAPPPQYSSPPTRIPHLCPALPCPTVPPLPVRCSVGQTGWWAWCSTCEQMDLSLGWLPWLLTLHCLPTLGPLHFCPTLPQHPHPAVCGPR